VLFAPEARDKIGRMAAAMYFAATGIAVRFAQRPEHKQPAAEESAADDYSTVRRVVRGRA
jgi:hypothetical protein